MLTWFVTCMYLKMLQLKYFKYNRTKFIYCLDMEFELELGCTFSYLFIYLFIQLQID